MEKPSDNRIVKETVDSIASTPISFLIQRFGRDSKEIVEKWTQGCDLSQILISSSGEENQVFRHQKAVYIAMKLLSIGCSSRDVRAVLVEKMGYSFAHSTTLLTQASRLLLSDEMKDTLRSEYETVVRDILQRARESGNIDAELRAVQVLAQITGITKQEVNQQFTGNVLFQVN